MKQKIIGQTIECAAMNAPGFIVLGFCTKTNSLHELGRIVFINNENVEYVLWILCISEYL